MCRGFLIWCVDIIVQIFFKNRKRLPFKYFKWRAFLLKFALMSLVACPLCWQVDFAWSQEGIMTKIWTGGNRPITPTGSESHTLIELTGEGIVPSKQNEHHRQEIWSGRSVQGRNEADYMRWLQESYAIRPMLNQCWSTDYPASTVTPAAAAAAVVA